MKWVDNSANITGFPRQPLIQRFLKPISSTNQKYIYLVMCVHTSHAHVLHIFCAGPVALVLIVTYQYLCSDLQAAPQRALLKSPEITAKTSGEKRPSNVLLLPPSWSWEERRRADSVNNREQSATFLLFLSNSSFMNIILPKNHQENT